jgi:hypothetical protein
VQRACARWSTCDAEVAWGEHAFSENGEKVDFEIYTSATLLRIVEHNG